MNSNEFLKAMGAEEFLQKRTDTIKKLLKGKYGEDFDVWYHSQDPSADGRMYSAVAYPLTDERLKFGLRVSGNEDKIWDEYVGKCMCRKMEEKAVEILKPKLKNVSIIISSFAKNIAGTDVNISLEEFWENNSSNRYALYLVLDMEEISKYTLPEQYEIVVELFRDKLLISGGLTVIFAKKETMEEIENYKIDMTRVDHGFELITEAYKTIKMSINQGVIETNYDAFLDAMER